MIYPRHTKFFYSEPIFMEDCLDSYIVGACMHLLDLPDIEAIPSSYQPLFDILPEEQQLNYIAKIAKDILDKYIKITDGNLK